MSAYDAIVVGAGTSGCVLAARLSEDPSRRVLVLEWANADPILVNLLEGKRHLVPRGTGFGGSGLINGGYFERPRRSDFDDWAGVMPGWEYEATLPFMVALEYDVDFGDQVGHGQSGPVRVARPSLDHPSAAAFVEASLAANFPFEADKNADETPGVGPIPLNIVDGVRWDMRTAYLAPALGRANLDVVVARATRLLSRGDRVVGVEAWSDGRFIEYRALEVVLAAGALGTARILQLSGIGPKEVLGRVGIEVMADLPVATAFSDHPQVRLDWTAEAAPQASQSLAVALNFDDLEIMPLLQPIAETFPKSGAPAGVFSTLITLETSQSRGRFEIGRVPNYNYLSAPKDVSTLRTGVRAAVHLMRSAAFAKRSVSLIDSPPMSDADLDSWILTNLGTAFHLSGTAPMGSVVDAAGRVFGVDGLRIGDISILPTVPSRGTALAAVVVAERVASAL